jgi:hypothetical protein
MTALLEALKFVGSCAGLVSAYFLVYDRTARGKPLTFLQLENWHVNLLVKNVADETIVVDKITVSLPAVSILTGDDTLAIVEAVAERFYPSGKTSRTFVVLGPQAERSFQLLFRPEAEKVADATPIKLVCVWRNTRKPWPLKRRAVIRTTMGDLQNLQAVAQKHKEAPA